MIDIKLIRENPDVFRKDLEKRKDKEKLPWIDDLLEKDAKWRQVKYDLQGLASEKNKISKDIAKAKKDGKDAGPLMKQLKELPEKIEVFEAELADLKAKIDYYLNHLPNLMHESVPYGADDTENVSVKEAGKKPKFAFELKSHGELAEDLGVADFSAAAKTSGAGFYYLKSDLALLNNALIQFALSKLVKKGYTYVDVPLMIRKAVCEGVTDYEFFKEMIYKIEEEDLHMLATSEHALMGLHMNSVLDEKQLPIKYVANSPCFRKEIGSHGVDEKGLFRVHQFHKVEQVILCTPEQSWKLHEELIANAEELFNELGLPYRVVNVCTGDLGIVAAKKYDLEVWMPRQEQYREACSCSNCTDYQARRLNIKVGKQGGDKRVLHSLNSTAIATSRVMVAILENFQQKDGTVNVPKALHPFMMGKTKISAHK